MRLLRVKPTQDATSLESAELQHSTQRPPRYAILSHTWGDDEVLIDNVQDINSFRRIPGPKSAAVVKCWAACRLACLSEIQNIWIDTCCIDKKNSAELSEAINSMFRYYAESEVCYVYLADVPDYDYVHHRHSKFRQSRWFERGWTLQELLAPKDVQFYSHGWKLLGNEADLKGLISSITRVPEDVLAGGYCQSPARSLAEVLSWASRRQTTVVEDGAYSLLGLMDINMPLFYGEGPTAFLRLQEELLRRYDDESLFAWEAPPNDALVKPYHGLRSPYLTYFEASHSFRHPTTRTKLDESEPKLLTGKGISLSLPRIEADKPNGLYLALLDCTIHGASMGHIQPAIQIQHLHGKQYARVDIHHIQTIALDQMIGRFDQVENYPMVFPGRPTPPKPVAGFVMAKEWVFDDLAVRKLGELGTTEGHGVVRVVGYYPPNSWLDIGPESDHVMFNLSLHDTSTEQLGSAPLGPLGLITIEHIYRYTDGTKEISKGVAYLIIGLDGRKGHYAGAVERTHPWAFLVPKRPDMTATTAFQSFKLSSRLLSDRPTQLKIEHTKDIISDLVVNVTERQFPGMVLYDITLEWTSAMDRYKDILNALSSPPKGRRY